MCFSSSERSEASKCNLLTRIAMRGCKLNATKQWRNRHSAAWRELIRRAGRPRGRPQVLGGAHSDWRVHWSDRGKVAMPGVLVSFVLELNPESCPQQHYQL